MAGLLELNDARDQVIEGDCIENMRRLPAGSVDLVFADPPYNLQLEGELPPSRQFQGRRRATTSGTSSPSFADYDRFTRDWLTAAGAC